MTLNSILNEVNVEFGNGQSLAVIDALKQRRTLDKTGAKDEIYTKTSNLSERKQITNDSISKVVNYLKKKGVWDKVSIKQNFKTTDLVFKGDGSCQVNYDDGGGILIPKEIINATTPSEQKTFIQKFRKKIQASTITEESLINEEIIGNTAIVYHRGDKNKLDHLLKQTYSNNSHIDFHKYNKALYTTTSMAAQLNQSGNLNDMKSTYGDFIIKLAFKGISNCWFCSYDEYKKYNNCTIDNWKEQQFKKFNISKEYWNLLAGSDKNFTSNHVDVSKFFEANNLLGARVKGIQYNGKYDGDCLLIYDWSTAVPLAVSNNEGKTWEKIDKNKTAFQRSNFKNNDYIDTNKKIKHELTPDENGNVYCSNSKLTTLKGSPQKVDRDFNCDHNQLTTLKGAPQEIGRDFDCSFNILTTLEGAPQEVGRDFNCSFNNLTTLKGTTQEVGRDFNCSSNQLTTLEGAPQEVGRDFNCNLNRLTTLKGAPQRVGRIFNCSFNDLTTLEGSPQRIGRSFNCSNNQLTTLKGAPQEIGGKFNCRMNKNLPKEEIIKYLKVAKISGEIYTNYGDFENQEKALKKLAATNYFPY